MIVLLVGLEMLGEFVDSLAQKCDLTWGEPVSASWVRKSVTICSFVSFANATCLNGPPQTAVNSAKSGNR